MSAKLNNVSLKRMSSLVLVATIMTSFFTSLFMSINVSADPTAGLNLNALSTTVTPEDQAKGVSYYEILTGCFWHATNGKIKTSNSNPDPSEWFNKDKEAWAFINGALVSCKDAAKEALTLWGWGSNYGTFLKDIGCKYNGVDQFTCDSNNKARATKFQNAVKANAYQGQNPILSSAGQYAMALLTMQNQCKIEDLGLMTALTPKAGEDVPTLKARIDKNYFTTDGSLHATVYVSVNMADDAGSFALHGITYVASYQSGYGPGNNKSGEQYVEKIPKFGAEYSVNTYGHIDQWSARVGDANHTIDNTSLMKTCTELANSVSKNAAAYAKFYHDHKTLTPGVGAGGSATTPGGSSTPTCGSAIQGIGWIICPVLNAVAAMNDGVFKLAEAMLNINPLQQDTSSTSIYTAWGIIRNLANVVFVILFMIVIFSQLTGTGITNYGIKKMLPRLIIGAIAINLSFLAMQLLVDVFNITGKSLFDLINNAAPGFAAGDWKNLISTAAATGLVGAGVYAGLSFASPEVALLIIAPSAIMAVLAWLAGFLTLVIRQAAIPIFAITSPFAFLAYILPNTQSWFKKWWNLLLPMLMLYPLAAIIFAGSKFAANIIVNNGGPLNLLIGLVVLALPMFSLPFLARKSGALLGAINGAMVKAADTLRKPVGEEFGEMANEARAEDLNSTARTGWRGALQRNRQSLFRRKQERGLRTKAQEYESQQNFNKYVADNADRLAGGMTAGSAAESYMRNAATIAEEEEIKNAQVPLQRELATRQANGEKLSDILTDQSTGASRTDAQRAAAMRMAASMGQDKVIRHLQNTLTDGKQKLALQEAINANTGALKDKAPDIVKGPAGAFTGSITGKDLVGYSSDTVEELMKYAVAQNQAGNDAVLKSIDSALTDIASDTGLQTTFSGDSGKVIYDTIQANPSIGNSLGSAAGISTTDFRIR